MKCYKDGDTPETIVENFDTLKLADVYAVISLYLNRTAEVETYLRNKRRMRTKSRPENRSRDAAAARASREDFGSACAWEAERNASSGQ